MGTSGCGRSRAENVRRFKDPVARPPAGRSLLTVRAESLSD